MLAVVPYGSETWTLTQLDWRQLESFHMRCQRWILHIRWHDYIYPTTKFCVALVCWQLLPAFANDVLDCSVLLLGLLTMHQQIGSFGSAAKHKTVSSHVLTGGVPEADLLP